MSAKTLHRCADPAERIAVRDDHQMCRRDRQHVFDHTVNVFVAKTVAVANQCAVRSADRRGEVSKQLNVRVGCCLAVLGSIWVIMICALTDQSQASPAASR